MSRHCAFLRGVSPMNASMAQLKACLESLGFRQVKTVLASGNAVFDAPATPLPVLEQRIEAATAQHLGRGFRTLVRPQAELQALLRADPFAAFALPPDAKRVVTFLRQPWAEPIALPHEEQGVRVLRLHGAQVLTAYVRHPRGPVFMRVIEQLFGDDVTTRTWDTVRRCAAA